MPRHQLTPNLVKRGIWTLHEVQRCNTQPATTYVSYTDNSFPPPITMLISLTVGKVDAGVAVLLTEDKRLVSNP